MQKNNSFYMAIFTLLGLVCGFAIAVLIQPSGASAQASGSSPAAAAANFSEGAASQSVSTSISAPQATMAGRAFNYQGLLRQSGQTVTALCDFQFLLWDALADGAQQGSTQTTLGVQVTGGVFTVLVNDADQFGTGLASGAARWLETSVRCPSGSGVYTTLTPRKALTAVPLAAGLTPYGALSAENTRYQKPGFSFYAPTGTYPNPVALRVEAGAGGLGVTNVPTGIMAVTVSGNSVHGISANGNAIFAESTSGNAGYFVGNVVVNGNLDVSGTFTYPKLWFKKFISSAGALPIVQPSLQTDGGDLILFVSGSGFTSTTGKWIGMNIKLDDVVVGTTGVYANNTFVHVPFISTQIVLNNVAAGLHSVGLEALPGTSTDTTDLFSVSVMQIAR